MSTISSIASFLGSGRRLKYTISKLLALVAIAMCWVLVQSAILVTAYRVSDKSKGPLRAHIDRHFIMTPHQTPAIFHDIQFEG